MASPASGGFTLDDLPLAKILPKTKTIKDLQGKVDWNFTNQYACIVPVTSAVYEISHKGGLTHITLSPLLSLLGRPYCSFFPGRSSQ